MIEDHHLALAISESSASPGERAWERFVATVERLLGHDLDGDQARDGYSLDYALEAFRAGSSADEYALLVRAEKAQRGTPASAATISDYPLIDGPLLRQAGEARR